MSGFRLVLALLLMAFSAIAFAAGEDHPDPHAIPVSSPRSQPVADSTHAPQSKFTLRDAMYIEDVVFGTDASGFRQSRCPLDASLIWTAALNTGVYASSVLTHLYSDTRVGRQVIVPGFHRDLNILDHDGHHVTGSPINMASEVYFHTSPLIIDFNQDGNKDMVWVNVDGEIYILNGDPTAAAAVMDYPFNIPKLKLKKKWYADLATNIPTTTKTPTPTPVSTPAATPPTTPPPTGRRLMSLAVNGYETPLQRMRREKKKRYVLRKVAQKLRSKRAARAATVASPRARVAGRRLLESAVDPVFDADDGIERDDEEGDEPVDEEEPAVPTDVEAAHAHLAALRAKYAGGSADPDHHAGAASDASIDEQERAFLKETGLAMPEPTEAEVDDQEPADETEEAVESEPEADADGAGEEATDSAQEEQGEADTRPPLHRHGGRAVEEELAEYGSEEIQAAIDEVVEEEPEFDDHLEGAFGGDAHDADSSVDSAVASVAAAVAGEEEDHDEVISRANYAQQIQELASKYTRQQSELYGRQRGEGDGKIQLPEMNSPSDGSQVPTGIASKDAQRLAELESAATKKNDINSNVVRILGSDKSMKTSETGEVIPEDASEPGLDAIYNQIGDGLTDEGRESLNLFTSSSSSHLDQYDPEVAWEMAELDRLYPVTEHEIWVDAHVLATPVLADLTGDGRPELIATVSYFFDDTDYHASPHLLKRLGSDVDIKKYVAGGLVVLDLWTHKILWHEHLDLTTDDVELKAHIYASPTVVDLDGDGVLEIIVATSLGLVYVFNSQTHAILRGFPITMHEIQAQVAVADVNQDGRLEMIAMDGKGNVLCFDITGKELWSTLISGFSSQPASFGDINGDGFMDVVVGTVSGHVWALNGVDGKVIPNFPLRTDGRIISPITLVNLDPTPQHILPYNLVQNGLHLVFPSFDGHVYIVDGRSGCTNKLDIGEHSYGQVLVADILGRGKLDLLVTTMNGNVFCFATEADATQHPMRAWTSQGQGLNGFTVRDGYHGVYFTEASKVGLSEIVGKEFQVEYMIVDERAKVVTPSLVSGVVGIVPARYDISFRFGGSIITNVTHHKPGLYSHTIPAGVIPQYTTIEIIMDNEHKQRFQDEVVSGMNVHFYKSIKVRRIQQHKQS